MGPQDGGLSHLMPSPPSTTEVSAGSMGVLMSLAWPQLPASSQIVFGFGQEFVLDNGLMALVLAFCLPSLPGDAQSNSAFCSNPARLSPQPELLLNLLTDISH